MANERLQRYPQKPRVFILSSISEDPSDAESLCRYLLYSNQFETEGLVACTSSRMKHQVCPEKLETIVNAYADAIDNLNKHVHLDWQYPCAEHLKGRIRKGSEVQSTDFIGTSFTEFSNRGLQNQMYGMAAVNANQPLSPGSELLYECIISPTTQPLWILCWGGANTLAQALLKLNQKYHPQDFKRLLSRIRVYAISDQDDTAVWIRSNFPDILYISSIHGWNQYGMATWAGFSGEKYYGFDEGGPDFSKMDRIWIKENIQIGPLGSAYPDYISIPEIGTPTFLHIIQNGLSVSEHPEYGSWGGRYALTDISTGRFNSNHYSDAADRVKVGDRTFTSNHATIWRWREAFQNDFAARIKWTIEADFSMTNHHPIITVNDVKGLAPIRIDLAADSAVTLDATGTYDPNGGTLSYHWWHYREPTATQWDVDAEVAILGIRKLDNEGRKVRVDILPPKNLPAQSKDKEMLAAAQLLHLILEVTNSGTPALTSYRRVLIQVSDVYSLGSKGEVDGLGERLKAL